MTFSGKQTTHLMISLTTPSLLRKWREVIRSASLLQSDRPDTETLRNSFTGEIAAPEQRQDLLNVRQIGQKHFIRHVQINVMQVSSAKSSKTKKHNLHTFSKQKVTMRKLTDDKKNRFPLPEETTYGTMSTTNNNALYNRSVLGIT